MKVSERAAWAIVIAITIAAPFMSYGAALIGEPQSKWLWCEMLKLCGGTQ